jgi:hypothetical protein
VSIKNGISMMLLVTIIFGIYNLITNLQASNAICTYYIICGIPSIALGAKQLNRSPTNDLYMMIQSWLGIAVVIVWGVFFFYMSYK